MELVQNNLLQLQEIILAYFLQKNVPRAFWKEKMEKELNYSFFGVEKAVREESEVHEIEVPVIDWLPSSSHVSKSKPDSPHKELEELKTQVLEYQNSTKLKIDRMNNSIQKWEQNYADLSQEISSKMAILLQKLNDQKKFDQKVQDIVDRHNNLLKGYEVRMNQLQKLLQQKESDFVEAHSALKEAKSEIARIKRL